MGPNSDDPAIMRALIENGMDVARFNFSHGTHEEQKKRIDQLKAIRKELKKPIAILLDTKGPEIRTGVLEGGRKVLLKDGQILDFNGIKVEAILCPGHTWGHMVYLIDDEYLFTGDTLWFGADGGYSFINALAEDNDLAKRSLAALEKELKERGLSPKIITGHTGWTDDFEFAFRHRDKVCNSFIKQKPHDPNAPYDGYDESDETEEKARNVRLAKQIDLSGRQTAGFQE